MTGFTPLVIANLDGNSAIVDPVTGKPTATFVQNYNNNLRNVLNVISQLSVSEGNTSSILAQLVALQGFQTNAMGQLVNESIASSYTSPQGVLTATTTGNPGTTSQIVVANHTRVYTDGTSKAVTGATITGLTPNAPYYVYYSDPSRNGGTETYMTTQDPTVAAQVNGIHNVGGVTTPANSTTTGTGTGGGGGTIPREQNCVCVESYMPFDMQAKDVTTWTDLVLLNPNDEGYYVSPTEAVRFAVENTFRIFTESGISLVLTLSTPITSRGGEVLDLMTAVLNGAEVPVLDRGDFRWERLTGFETAGKKAVAYISAHDGTYAAGEYPDRYIFTHNATQKP